MLLLRLTQKVIANDCVDFELTLSIRYTVGTSNKSKCDVPSLLHVSITHIQLHMDHNSLIRGNTYGALRYLNPVLGSACYRYQEYGQYQHCNADNWP